MAQANAIIVRIRRDEAAEFERLFESEELPLWEELSREGKFLQARLARVEYGIRAGRRCPLSNLRRGAEHG